MNLAAPIVQMQFVRLTQAYETLMNPRLRADYLRRGRRATTSSGNAYGASTFAPPPLVCDDRLL